MKIKMILDQYGDLQNVEEVAHIFDECNLPVIPDKIMKAINSHLEYAMYESMDSKGEVNGDVFYYRILARFRAEVHRTHTKPCPYDYERG